MSESSSIEHQERYSNNPTNGKNILAADFSRRNFLLSAVDTAMAYGTARVVERVAPEVSGLVTRHILSKTQSRAEALTSLEDPYLKEVEARYNIRLISEREAYQVLGLPFNPHDTSEFTLPIPVGWDKERIALIDEFLPLLPNFFYEPDDEGHKLMLALTNFGTSCSCDGEYSLGKELIELEGRDFTSTNKRWALEVLAHEATHRMQDLRADKQYTKLTRAMRMSFADFAKIMDPKLTMLNDDDSEASFVHDRLAYGFENVQDGKKVTRTDAAEFEASLSMIYLHGQDYFTSYCGEVFGDEVAERLYEYMRDEVFGGKTYDAFPLQEPKPPSDEDIQLEEAAVLYDDTIDQFISKDEVQKANFSHLPSTDLDSLHELEHEGQLTIQDDTFPDNGRQILITYHEVPEAQTPIVVLQKLDNQGLRYVQRISFSIDRHGQRAPTSKQTKLISGDTMPDIRSLFRLPDVPITWTTYEGGAASGGLYKRGLLVDGNNQYELLVQDEGQLTLTVTLLQQK